MKGSTDTRVRRLSHGDVAPLVDHLEELRRRIFWCLGWFVCAFVIMWWRRSELLDLLAAPLPSTAPKPVTLAVAEPFTMTMRVCGYAALAGVSPVLAWHGWSFIAPALGPRAHRAVVWITLLGSALFAAGITFGYFVAVPQALAFLIRFGGADFSVQLRASELYHFTVLALGACGLVFELPIVIVGLARLRIVSVERLRRNRRVGWAAMAVLAVLLPGVDPIVTGIEAVPLLVLYELTVFVTAQLDRRWRSVDAVATTRDDPLGASGLADAA